MDNQDYFDSILQTIDSRDGGINDNKFNRDMNSVTVAENDRFSIEKHFVGSMFGVQKRPHYTIRNGQSKMNKT